MNCRDFAAIVFELADERRATLSAAARRTALAHALGCVDCAAQLRAARRLDESLTDAALATDQAVAPARLKASLRAAFEQSRAVAPVASVAVTPPPVKRERFNLRRIFVWPPQFNLETGLAWTAALILIGLTFGVLLPRLLSWTNAPQPQVTVAQPTPQPTLPPSAAPTPDVAKLASNAAANEKPAVRTVVTRRPRAARQSAETLPATNTSDLATTGFMPLTYTATAPQDGMVVRVAVPRATLLAMGMPVNAARTGENVQADVLMGMDGVALAIRLVNEGGVR